ncbi:MAG TPA: RNA polymerase sigma-54 factor, partial [Ignavibacteriaceae bacterium]|nr:RNA polymerase sigma-54 factor [Ignavibacteriaceae bacterium]HRQ53568.1 RNA polymerase sigma-54 factor [Ignavibacteriaceae bacterium]
MLSLSQRLTQSQKLSPQQIQYQKLLQLNTLALEQRIKTELEMNPVLEEELEMTLEQDDKEKDSDSEKEDEFSDKDNEEFDIEDYSNDDDFDHERINRSADEEIYQPLAPQRESLSEHLT